MSDHPDFIATLGLPFVAHRVRRVAELLRDGYGDWLCEAGVRAPARSLSTLLLLDREGPTSVTEIARRLRLSHPLIIKLVRQLRATGLVETSDDPADGRRRIVALTAEGQAEAASIGRATILMEAAYRDLFAESGVDLLEAVERIETSSAAESFADRLRRLERS